MSQSVLLFFMQVVVPIVILISTHMVFLEVCRILKFSIQSLDNIFSGPWSKTNYKEPKGS